jgi:hypothetical protein
MAQPGYCSCGGCGRLFKLDSEAEMLAMDQHDCQMNDDELDYLIGENIKVLALRKPNG